MSASIIIPSNNENPHPGHIHNLGQGSYAHHARCSFQSTERGTCRAIFRGVPFVRVRADLRDVIHGGEIAKVETCQVSPPNLLGGISQALRSLLSTPLLKFLQEPFSSLADRLKSLSWLLAVHDQQRTNRSLSWVTRNKSRVTKCL